MFGTVLIAVKLRVTGFDSDRPRTRVRISRTTRCVFDGATYLPVDKGISVCYSTDVVYEG